MLLTAAVVGFLAVCSAGAEDLEIGVYYEALCPDSRDFIVKQLQPTWDKVADILHVTFVPWGNAKFDGTTVTCQHGPEECWGNRLHACVIANTRSDAARMQAVSCLMSDYERLNTTAPDCVRQAGLDWSRQADCAESDASLQRVLLYGQMTEDLLPPVTFIPTVTVDGRQDGQAAMLADFLAFVCETWRSQTGDLPAGCQDLH